MKKIIILFLFTNSFLYSQIYPVVIPDFKDFLGSFISNSLKRDNENGFNE